MKTFRYLTRPGLRTTVALGVLALAGCTAFENNRPVVEVFTTDEGSSHHAQPIPTGNQAEIRAQLSRDLLAKPLGMDEAVQLVLANSPAMQGLLAQSRADLSQPNQTLRRDSPIFTFERMRYADGLEVGRLLSFGVLDLQLLPQGPGVFRETVHDRVQLATTLVEQVAQTRQAWVQAVGAQQSLQYARQVHKSAQASAELARRMQQVGNFNKLQRARQQSFYADATAQLAASQHAATAAREALTRQLALSDEQAGLLKLPDRLPDLPGEPRTAESVSSRAAEQRLDIQMARYELDMAAKSQGIDLLGHLGQVENIAAISGSGKRQEPGITLPTFNWRDLQRSTLKPQSLGAVTHYEGTVRSAGSQLRESYSGYRTAYDVARHYRDEIVPLRKSMHDENVLRYNGMLIGVFELLADNREQISSVMAAINAYQQFWMADAVLASSLTGKPVASMNPSSSSAKTGGPGGAGH